MSRRKPLPALVSLLLVGGALIAATPAATGATSPAGSTGAAAGSRSSMTTVEFERRVLSLVNSRRAAVGCPALKPSTTLTKAARAHTRRMAAAGNLSHQLPGEAALGRRITSAGYRGWTAAAENLAWGGGTPRAVHGMWMRSSGHRGNIQRCVYRDAGVGVVFANGTPWVTLDLGRRR